MKFGHIADAHIGCWRDPKMKQLSVDAFREACNRVIRESADFLLIAGDLFHTAIPSLDLVKAVVRTLQDVNDAGIPVYFIAGSHDFSPTGKTMLDVIEEADLGQNVTQGRVVDGTLKLRFTEDASTGAKLTGMIGRKGMLDQEQYQDLDTESLEAEPGKKIFMFHTAIDELKPSDLQMEASPVTILPEGFDYYAGGHVHVVEDKDYSQAGYDHVVYPGPLFPTNYAELEKIGRGGFYFYDDGEVRREDISLRNVVSITVEADEEKPETVHEKVRNGLEGLDVEDAIVTVRVKGELVGGRTSDVGFDEIYEDVMDSGAFYFLKNTNALQTESFDADVDDDRSHEEIEAELIREYAGQIDHAFDDEVAVVEQLLQRLSDEKQDGETNDDYEDRMIGEAESIIESHLNDTEQTAGDENSGTATTLDAFVDND